MKKISLCESSFPKLSPEQLQQLAANNAWLFSMRAPVFKVSLPYLCSVNGDAATTTEAFGLN